MCHFQNDAKWPLEVDTHNATWQCKQAVKTPGRQHNSERAFTWYTQQAAPGLVVPVRVQNRDGEHIELDSIDRVQAESQTLHLNKYGWFGFDGHLVETHYPERTVSLLKPTKSIMQAACCGHSWNHKSRIPPRSLSMREMMLSTQIDWKKFTLLPIKNDRRH